MAQGDIVTSLRYNEMVLAVRRVLGNGGGTGFEDYGYGQNMQSSDVIGAVDTANASLIDTVSHQDMVNLLADINDCVNHQTGATSPSLAEIQPGDTIGEFESDDTVNGDNSGLLKGYADYEAVVASLVANRDDAFDIDPFAFTPQTTTTDWGGSVVHICHIQFEGGYSTIDADGTATTASGEDHYRHFFNAGGYISFTASVSPDTTPADNYLKNQNWADMLDAMNDIRFGRTTTESSTPTVGTGTSIGARNIPIDSTYRVLYTKSGSSFYSENYYQIEAQRPAANELIFRISFVDADPTAEDIDTPGYPATPELVTGETISTVFNNRPTNSFVSVPAPTLKVAQTYSVS